MVLDFLSESALLAVGEVLGCRLVCNRPLLDLGPCFGSRGVCVVIEPSCGW